MYVIVVWLGMLILVALNNSCYVCVSLFVYHVHLGTLLLTRPCAKLSRSSYVKRGVGTLCLFVCLLFHVFVVVWLRGTSSPRLSLAHMAVCQITPFL